MAAKKSGQKETPVSVGSVTNRRFYTVISIILLFMILLCLAVGMLTYFLGISQGKTKVESRHKDIEIRELITDGQIKEEVNKIIPDTGANDFWQRLYNIEP